MGSLILPLRIDPNTPEELARTLGEAARAGEPIRVEGAGTKGRMAGPLAPNARVISTAGLRRVLRYEPRDLTVSVEAGLPWSEFARLLSSNGQMAPLDPPFAGNATVGGVVAANSSGPRRRLYGTARDMVIGMRFATLEGKLIDSGGMVVKNVAGLDMAKLLIGSLGTLAAIVVVNFRVYPRPAAARTFRLRASQCAEATRRRDAILRGPLTPMSVDLVKDAGGYALLVEAGGSERVLERYSRELAGFETLEAGAAREVWLEVRQRTPLWLATEPGGAVVRVSCTLTEVGPVMERLPALAIARAASGVCYGYFAEAAEAVRWVEENRKGTAVVEFAPQATRERATLWPRPGNDFGVMQRIKRMFDPAGLLNPGRMYGRI